MAGFFRNSKRHETFTASDFFAITPSDTVELRSDVRAILVGGAGDVVARNEHDEDVTITASAGQLIPIQTSLVLSTGTTATGLVGLV